MKRILVTTDGSETAKKALLEAKGLAEALNAKLDIINVVKEKIINPYSTLDQTTTQKAIEHFKKTGYQILEDSLKLFNDFDGEVNTKLKAGDPADAIINEVEKESYDLVIMGSRGLSTFSRAMLGSVSHKVLNHVEVNVLIVK
ncbi:MAG: universal stress protein [Tissierella sp.]|uniref:universal stress protein n=1 Tax=Tissierella sp. TaxID=41274 RepID=UPI003F9C48F2